MLGKLVLGLPLQGVGCSNLLEEVEKNLLKGLGVCGFDVICMKELVER